MVLWLGEETQKGISLMSMFVFFFRNWDKNLATNCSCQTCWSSLCSDWWSISCCYGTSTSILSEQGWPKRQRASRGPWTSWLLCRKLPTIWWMLEGYKGLMWVLVMHSKPNIVWLNFAEVLDIAKLSAWCLFIVEITSLHQNFICLCYSWKILHDILDNSVFQEMHFFSFYFVKKIFSVLLYTFIGKCLCLTQLLWVIFVSVAGQNHVSREAAALWAAALLWRHFSSQFPWKRVDGVPLWTVHHILWEWTQEKSVFQPCLSI